VTPASVGALFDVSYDFRKESAKTTKEAFGKLRDEITRMVAEPETLASRMEKNLEPITAAAPTIATHVKVQAQNDLKHLYDALPTAPPAQNLFRPTDENWEPSPTEIATFEKRLAVAENPLSVIEDLKRGTLSPESVDALRALRPRLFAELQEMIATELPKLDADMPVVPELEPKSIAAAQEAHAQTAEEKGAMPKSKATPKTIKAHQTMAERLMSK
jgi:hypothetical protein